MSFTTNDFPKLLDVINTHPEWRQQLVTVLFPDIDLAQSMRELKQALRDLSQAQVRTEQSLKEAAEDRLRIRAVQARTEQSLKILTRRADEAAEDRQHIHAELKEATEDRRRIETKFDVKLDEAAEDRQRTNVRLHSIHQDVAKLKGDSYERTIKDNATGLFGIVIRRGKEAKGKISEQLYKAMTAGKISNDDFIQVMAIDLLWSGLLRVSGLEVVLAIEASWCAELNDLERAVTRANVLKTIGIKALPVVAGTLWDNKLFELAVKRCVVVVEDKRVNQDTWDSALRVIFPSS